MELCCKQTARQLSTTVSHIGLRDVSFLGCQMAQQDCKHKPRLHIAFQL